MQQHLKANEADEEIVETIFPIIANVTIDPSDEKCSKENMMKLFLASQFLIKSQQIYSDEDQDAIDKLQNEVDRLKAVSDGTGLNGNDLLCHM